MIYRCLYTGVQPMNVCPGRAWLTIAITVKLIVSQGQPEDDDLSDHGAGEAVKAGMAIAPEADDTPSGSATTQSSDPPPAEGQAHAMEVDDEDGGPPPASPVSPADDDLLTGSGAVGLEGDMANLTVSSPKDHDGGGEDASV